ncbi:DNA polymerase III subunit gamma/tau [Sinobaca sp. H24]|uniref:DNA polymerase III subunit gamma/tau n=1 Tax=Sinobaca sp. H24 TaxID=2923376 RepID=UPI00207A5844|nr:DNA polymerase III subunit gamma/tau [Sinobaca sp. H24]
MGYQALYRVWRPRQLKDMAGQEHITKTLQNALEQEKFSHAYLFSGPRGTGKTSAAKIIAKAINCEHAPVREPCNECRACRGISDGSVVDVIEIDAASNNGVDEIRYIRENVMSAPRDISYKVYIIDEVHMLSTGAFNALLKTLEEPPKHAVFILATTEPHKIPLTIVSRCQRFDFKRITTKALTDRMNYIISQQEWTAEEEAVQLIARAAEGGMRDALSLLDQASSFAEDTITPDDVLAITGAVSQRFLAETIRSILAGDTSAAVRAADRLIQDGKDPVRFMEDVIYYLRDMLVAKTAPNVDEILDRVMVDDAFKELTGQAELSWIYKVLNELNTHFQQMKWSSHPKIFLEMALIQTAHVSPGRTEPEQGREAASVSSDTYERLEKKVEQLEQKLNKVKEAPASEKTEETSSSQAPKRKAAPRTGGSQALGNDGKVRETIQGASREKLQELTGQWAAVMQKVKQTSVPGHAWISDAKPVATNGEKLILAFQNEMHRSMVDTKFRDAIESSIQGVTGQSLEAVTLLNQQWEKVKQEYKNRQPASEEKESEPEKDPFVDEAIKLVGEDLLEIKD